MSRKKKRRKVHENRIGGAAGNVDEAVGKVTSQKNLEVSAAVARSAGGDTGKAKEPAADMVQSVQNGAHAVDDLVRRTIEERPYMAAVGALAVRWVIGRMGGA